MMKMTKDQFRSYMNTLIAFEDYLDKVNNIGINLWDITEISELEMLYISLIEDCLGLTRTDNYGSDISFFLFECDKGRANNAFIEVNGEKHYIRTVDELYDWLEFDINKHNN